MQALTLLIGVVVSIAVLFLRPIHWLIIYMAALAWYPSYLTVRLETIDFSATRIITISIYANLFLRTRLPSQFKLIWLDRLVIVYFIAQILAGITTIPLGMLLENRAGAVFDMVLPYFAVRMIITSKEQYLTLLKGILVIAAPLALVGFYECLTSHNPMGFLRRYHAWGGGVQAPINRYGFYRAAVTFPMSIMFGLFHAMLGPACAGILHNAKRYKPLCWVGLGLMVVGVFSSMSSGPMLVALFSIAFIAFYRWRRYWKPVVITAILMCGTVEIISNRHFYDVLGGFTLNPATAWYRSKLIDVGLFKGGMTGHWITGYGFTDPGWNIKIDGRGHTDVPNHYLGVLCRYGLVGLLPFLMVIVAAGRRLNKAFRVTVTEESKWLIWSLAGAFLGVVVALASVMLFGQPKNIFFMILGLCGSAPSIISTRAPDRLILIDSS